MSCPREESLSFYVDGELPLGEVRQLESHLVQCRRCRATVLALRDEVAVLADVLHDRDLGPARVEAPRERARGLVIGVGPALGIAALVVTTGGWLLESNLPAGTSWLSPIRLMGAYEMILETIFMLRDEAPGLIETALAQGALFAIAAVLTFLVSTLDKRLTRTSAVVLAALGAAAVMGAPEAAAFELRHDEDRVVIAAGDTFSQTLIVKAEDVRIEGTIDGDLIVLAEHVRVTGAVTGSVLAVADRVDVLGRVGGTLYVAGGIVRVEGEVAGPLYGISEDMTLDESSSVAGDAATLGERVRVEGRIGRDLFFGGDSLEVRGRVERDLKVRGEEVSLLDGAHVVGDFDVQLPSGHEAEVAAGATIGGERLDGVLDWHHPERGSRWTDGHFYMGNLVFLVSAFIVGMLAQLLRPGLFEGGLPTTADFFRELGIGFVTLIVAPFAIVICFVTVVGIPVGLIALFAYLTGIFVSMIVVASLLGHAVLARDSETRPRFGTALLLGLLILTVATSLPFLGGLVRFVALMTGVGMLVTHFVEAWRLRAA